MSEVTIKLTLVDLIEAAKDKAMLIGVDPYSKSNGRYELTDPSIDIDHEVGVTFEVLENSDD